MKRFLYSAILLIIGTTFFACYQDENPVGALSDEFYLRHKGADLPVWVKGNPEKETFIIFLHGGPLLSAIETSVVGTFEELEEEYVVVYYDQRGGGYTHGSGSENLNEAQFVEDLEVLVDLLQEKYPQAKNLFLMGHSWGGYLGTAFLASGDNQQDFKGWLELAGAHNFPLNWASSRDFGIQFCQDKIAQNDAEKKKWENRLQALEDTPIVNSLTTLRVVNFIAQLIERETLNLFGKVEQPSNLYWLSSPTSTGLDQRSLELLENLLVTGNQNPKMPNITLPSLLIYGGRDAIVPQALGQNAYDFLGTDPADKELLILEDSPHDLWSVDEGAFFEALKGFVEQYR